MDKADKEKIKKIVEDRKKVHQFLARKSQVYKAFVDLENKAFISGELDRKYKELIALGVSIVINCESCMEWHTHQALGAGASEAEILETIEVGIEMGGGPATVSSRFVLKVLEYYQREQKNEEGI